MVFFGDKIVFALRRAAEIFFRDKLSRHYFILCSQNTFCCPCQVTEYFFQLNVLTENFPQKTIAPPTPTTPLKLNGWSLNI